MSVYNLNFVDCLVVLCELNVSVRLPRLHGESVQPPELYPIVQIRIAWKVDIVKCQTD